jgi:hypothetical protein
MSRYLKIIILFTFLAEPAVQAQSQQYNVSPASFSTRINDEFSPVFYMNGIVFCSNLSDNSLVSYNDDQNRLFKIFYVSRRGSNGWNNPKLLAKEITTGFNDGPVTFNETGTLIYFSRNNSIKNSMRNISDTSNKLGIYYSESVDGIWTDIKAFKWNNVDYSFGTPALTPNGKRLYFSSDRPGGSGEMDLYYCELINSEWASPVNLGPAINTSQNESFPFVSSYGRLYFASDGLKGFGGKDIFYTQEINGEWMTPVHLDSAINSPFDDFGIVADSTSENGFFSTNRRKTDDIFSFNLISPPVEFPACDTIRKNNFCYTFYDEKHKAIDTLTVTYQWDFGDSKFQIGKEVRHCFPGPGKYVVKLSITDDLTGDTISEQAVYDVELKNIEQAIIKSDSIGPSGRSISFEGLTTDMPGFRFTDYLWDFGEGFIQGGPIMNKSFKKRGEYFVKLGLLSEPDYMGVIQKKCFMKKIKIN